MKKVWTRLQRLLPADPRVRLHVLVMVIVLAAGFASRVRHIVESLPYCRHPDESTWANIAIRMVREGDMNPHRFRKPSLPVYVMYVGFAVGYLDARLHDEASSASDLGEKVTPYYEVPRVAVPPKITFALASIAAMGFGGYIAFLLTRRAMALWLAPLLLSLSASYYRLSWSYMNVDIIGAAFALATIAYLVHMRVRADVNEPEGSRGLRRAIIAGTLAGLTVGSKYNLFPVLLPCVLWFLFYERKRLVSRTLVVGTVSVVAFFVTSPYILLDFHTALDDILKEVRHYASGHGGETIEPGWPMIQTYFEHFAENFGWIPLFVAALGALVLARRDVRLAIVTFAYPIAFTTYMCSQRVFFERNVVGVHVFVAIALAVALLELPGVLSELVARRWPAFGARAPRLFAAVLVGLCILGAPWGRSGLAYASGVEPRNDAERWVLEQLDRRTIVIVDEKVEMDRRRLSKKYRTHETSLSRDEEKVAAFRGKGKRIVVIIRSGQRQQYVNVLGKMKEVARFARPPERPGGVEIKPVEIIERR